MGLRTAGWSELCEERPCGLGSGTFKSRQGVLEQWGQAPRGTHTELGYRWETVHVPRRED